MLSILKTINSCPLGVWVGEPCRVSEPHLHTACLPPGPVTHACWCVMHQQGSPGLPPAWSREASTRVRWLGRAHLLGHRRGRAGTRVLLATGSHTTSGSAFHQTRRADLLNRTCSGIWERLLTVPIPGESPLTSVCPSLPRFRFTYVSADQQTHHCVFIHFVCVSTVLFLRVSSLKTSPTFLIYTVG